MFYCIWRRRPSHKYVFCWTFWKRRFCRDAGSLCFIAFRGGDLRVSMCFAERFWNAVFVAMLDPCVLLHLAEATFAQVLFLLWIQAPGPDWRQPFETAMRTLNPCVLLHMAGATFAEVCVLLNVFETSFLSRCWIHLFYCIWRRRPSHKYMFCWTVLKRRFGRDAGSICFIAFGGGDLRIVICFAARFRNVVFVAMLDHCILLHLAEETFA